MTEARKPEELKNLFSPIPDRLQGELIDTLGGNGNCRIERIVSFGHTSPPGFWYDQNQDEFVVLLRGQAAIRFERGDRLIVMEEGDYLTIKAREKHRVEWTAKGVPTVWLTAFYRPV